MTTPAYPLHSLIPPLSIPDRIRAIRYFSGLNQTELSKMLECSQGTISKLENGELEPTAFHLVRMREVFGVSIDAIVDGLIPYRAIAERFSNSSLVPPRYARGAATKLKFLFPLVRVFEQRHGFERTQKELQKLGLKSAVFAEPELLVSSQTFHDLIEIYRECGAKDAKEFLNEVQKYAGEIQASLPTTTSGSSEEWTTPEKWNLQSTTSDDSAWGPRPYANAVVKGLRSGISIDTNVGRNTTLGFRRARA
jgi:transcriptional regulator with XRE-family HTH domain